MIVRREKALCRHFQAHIRLQWRRSDIHVYNVYRCIYLYSFTTARRVLNREVAHARTPSWSFVPKCRNDSLGGILQGCWGHGNVHAPFDKAEEGRRKGTP
jgi:hypothetical protein